ALAPLEKRLGRGVDPLVPRDEEVIDTQEVDDLEDRVAVREQASEHLLLGGFVEGDLAVRADVDHAEYPITGVLSITEPYAHDSRGGSPASKTLPSRKRGTLRPCPLYPPPKQHGCEKA